MSFVSDKDLRKAPAKRIPPKNSANSTTSRGTASESTLSGISFKTEQVTGHDSIVDNVVERARIEREQRQINRNQAGKVLIIQRTWRGRNQSKKFFNGLYSDTDKKINDTEKVSVTLNSRGVKFVAPEAVIVALLRQILFRPIHGIMSKRSKSTRFLDENMKRLCKFLEIMFLPAVSTVPEKNILLAMTKPHNSFLLKAFMDILFESINYSLSKRSTMTSSQRNLIIRTIIALLTGGGTVDSPQIDISSILRLKIGDDVVFDRFYSFLTMTGDLMLQKSSNDDLKLVQGMDYSSNDLAFDVLTFISSQKSIPNEDSIKIFSIPLLTNILSIEKKSGLTSNRLFSEAVIKIKTNRYESSLPFSSTSAAGMTSGHWLLGNITSMSLHVVSQGFTPLNNYLDSCRLLLHAFPLPMLLCGRAATIWTKQGASLTATTVPLALQQQILLDGILNTAFLRSLSDNYLVAIPMPSVSSSELEKDSLEIAESLKKSNNALSIAQDSIKIHAESSTPFTSKWAQRLLSGISPSINFSTPFSGSSLKTPVPVTNSALVDINVTVSIIRLLAAVLPMGALATPDSVPWKSLSALSFSKDFINRLWASLEYLIKHFYGQQASLQTFAMGFDANKDVFSDTNGNVIFAAVSCVSAVLKVLMIATDDDDLYIRSMPLSLAHFMSLIRAGKIILARTIRCHQGTALDPFGASSLTVSIDNNDQISANIAETMSSSAPSFASYISSWFSASSKAASESVVQPLPAPSHTSTSSGPPQQRLEIMGLYGAVRCLSSVLSDLHTRWARRPFSKDHTVWELKGSDGLSIGELKNSTDAVSSGVLRLMPWTIPFSTRLRLIRDFMDRERQSLQVVNNGDLFSQAFMQERSKGTIVRIRRSNIVADGMAAFAQLKAVNATGSLAGSIRDRIVVRYIDSRGEEEKGIDLGGLFKDFLTDLSQKVFDPSYGLFASTPIDGLLYPNPAASTLFGYETSDIFRFVGLVLGKAVYEDITIQPQFAHFFLAFMHGKYSFLHLADDLKSLDAELVKNLNFLKTYEGDISDLCLTFSVTDSSFGTSKEIELFPGGSQVSVTSSNRARYIDEVAKYYLHDRIKGPAQAFFNGLYEVVEPDLLSIFSAPELQVIISGVSGGLDVDDLKRNSRYAGGYLPLDTYTGHFWSIVAELDDTDRARLLRFVTSCERAPSLGFAALQPPFTIQRVDCSDDARLPSASTCFNILKLPTYSSKKIMKDRLLTAIRSGSGFDLS